MKKILMAAAIGVLGAPLAHAADVAARPYTKAPAMLVDPAYNWSGWYVGINGGYIDRESAQVIGTPISNDGTAGAPFPYAGLAAAAATGRIGRSQGGLGGAQIGYNWKIKRAVFGIEADIDGASLRSNTTVTALTPAPGFPGFPFASTFNGSQKLDYIGTVRGRIGLLMGAKDALLLYATGGLAYGQVSSSVALTQQITPTGVCTVCFPQSTVVNSSSTRVGWTAGAGAEWMFVPNWSVKAEGLYYDLGGFSTAGTLVNPNTTTLFTVTGVRVDNRTTGVMARAGINWHFGSPVVAKY
jgi:outer membrane immunogenic protein